MPELTPCEPARSLPRMFPPVLWNRPGRQRPPTAPAAAARDGSLARARAPLSQWLAPALPAAERRLGDG
jgi:hypothetical protein